jgi:hypothetical protein
MTEREVLEFLATHFAVKVGPNKDRNQYGHLELWWAAKSVAEEGSALYNPWMMIGNAENSYSLAAMGELRGALDKARKLCAIGDVK